MMHGSYVERENVMWTLTRPSYIPLCMHILRFHWLF